MRRGRKEIVLLCSHVSWDWTEATGKGPAKVGEERNVLCDYTSVNRER